MADSFRKQWKMCYRRKTCIWDFGTRRGFSQLVRIGCAIGYVVAALLPCLVFFFFWVFCFLPWCSMLWAHCAVGIETEKPERKHWTVIVSARLPSFIFSLLLFSFSLRYILIFMCSLNCYSYGARVHFTSKDNKMWVIYLFFIFIFLASVIRQFLFSLCPSTWKGRVVYIHLIRTRHTTRIHRWAVWFNISFIENW